MKSQLHFHHATCYSCSYVVNFIHEYLWKQICTCKSFETQTSHYHIHHITAAKHFSATATTIISQLHHITTAKHFTTAKLSYHNYTILVPQNILQRQLHFSCTLYSIKNLRFTKIRVSWNVSSSTQI